MSLLFAHPIVVVLTLALAAYAWSVWSGALDRRWRGGAVWALGTWPLVATAAVVPVVAGPVFWATERLGLRSDTDALAFLAVSIGLYVVPGVVLTMAAPRRSLPSWARARWVPFPDAGLRADAVPAIHVPSERRRGIGRVGGHLDGEPGFVWIDGDHLRFRAVQRADAVPASAATRVDLEAQDIEQLDLRFDAELRLEPPRGGWWTRRRLDVEVAALDHIGVRGRRPWTREGVLSLEVAGRSPIRLSVADVDWIVDQLDIDRPAVSPSP